MLKLAEWYGKRVVSYVLRPRVIVQERPVLLGSDNICEHPIFLIGVHRSGTSLVRRMFNSHSKIACPPETFYLEHYVRMLEDPVTFSGYEGFGYDREAMRADIAATASRLHEAFRLTQGKERWADKTPQYVWWTEGIDRLFGGRPYYVLIQRHPYDIVFSLVARKWRFNDIEDLFTSNLTYVRDSVAKMNEFEAAHPDRCIRLRYETLTTNPTDELTRVLTFLGEQFEPGMLTFYEKSHNQGLEDPMVLGTRGISGSHENWRSWTDAQKQEAAQILGETAKGLGYSIQ
ncbi:sulfotransferase family protein [Ancylobacter pratisalsi]|uniref:Sulfotransferase n=1 Tax=Ancylobacter pratisalsi TaxID=1745854 RepID=A0A6P1YNI0_9HYPH|nr:sulfotransferase [Ancylobacter pratisalsi]QIB34271.1 sulfotransferase [Ancylobacter pratisalsi]